MVFFHFTRCRPAFHLNAMSMHWIHRVVHILLQSKQACVFVQGRRCLPNFFRQCTPQNPNNFMVWNGLMMMLLQRCSVRKPIFSPHILKTWWSKRTQAMLANLRTRACVHTSHHLFSHQIMILFHFTCRRPTFHSIAKSIHRPHRVVHMLLQTKQACLFV